MAVANTRDPAQGRAHLCYCPSQYGALPGLCLWRQPASALSVAEGGPPHPVCKGQAARGRGPPGAAGRHVGGGRYEPERRGGAGAPASLRQALFHERVRHRDPAPVAARRVRLLRRPAAASQTGGRGLFHDAKDLVEPGESLPAPVVSLAGHRRLERPGPHAPRGDLQLAGPAPLAGQGRKQLPRQGYLGPLPAALWHRRWRGRAGRGAPGAPAAPGGPGAPAPRAARAGGHLL